MPRKLSGPGWGRTVGIAGAAGAAWALAFGVATADAAVGALPGGVAEGCVERASAPVFAPFGDPASYFLMPGGDFEGTLDWAHTGRVTIVDESEPFQLNSAGDHQSLRMRSGASVTSPPLCVTADMPHLRLVARSGVRGRLGVTVRLHAADGAVVGSSSVVVDGAGHQSWAPTQNIDLATEKLVVGQAAYVDIRFKSHGDWQLDDIFVDPYAR